MPKRSGRKRLIIIIAAVLLIAVLAFCIHAATRHKSKAPAPNNSPGLVKPPGRAASTVTPLGGSATGSGDTADLSIKVVGAINDPQTTGDKPDPGTEYVEIDLSVTNDGQAAQIIPGTFVYRTQSGKLLYTADSKGKGPEYANKNVQVTGEQSVNYLSLNPGQTDDSHYLIYQIPANAAAGQLIWYDGYYDTNSTKLAVFDLP